LLPHEACPASPGTSLDRIWTRSLWPTSPCTKEAALLVSLAQDPNEEYRSDMEDGHTVVDPMPLQDVQNGERWGFFAVYDGHGGAKEMKFCEAHLHSLVASELRDRARSDRSDVANALRSAFGKVDAELAKLGSFKSGCTATVAIARRLPQGIVELHIGNVGDSRALLVGTFGTRRLSIDHRTSDCSELVRIKQAGGFVYNRRVGGKLAVTRALGDHDLKPSVSGEPDVCTYRCESSDEVVALVIASDGLWDSVEDDEVHELLTQCLRDIAPRELGVQKASAIAELREIAGRTLAEKAKARGSKDNITVLVAFF